MYMILNQEHYKEPESRHGRTTLLLTNGRQIFSNQPEWTDYGEEE
jgi:hypothetical protein